MGNTIGEGKLNKLKKKKTETKNNFSIYNFNQWIKWEFKKCGHAQMMFAIVLSVSHMTLKQKDKTMIIMRIQ